MNIVYLSPQFPENQYNFCLALKEFGANVLGLGDAPYDTLRPELRFALTEYYRVGSLNNYDQLIRALGFFIHKYGKISRIESNNSALAAIEAKLRLDFNIPGFKSESCDFFLSKIKQKNKLLEYNFKVLEGKIIRNKEEAISFIEQNGYPVIARPDSGDPDLQSYTITTETEIHRFFKENLRSDYLFEEYPKGEIISLEGMTDKNGTPVFYTAHCYSPLICLSPNYNNHLLFYSLRYVPTDIEKTGLEILKKFNITERFFQILFLRNPKDTLPVVLHIQIYLANSATADIFNYANDIDIYQQWANIIINNRFSQNYERQYHCCYAGCRFDNKMLHPRDVILEGIKHVVIQHFPVSDALCNSLGNFGYILRSPSMEDIKSGIEYISKTGNTNYNV